MTTGISIEIQLSINANNKILVPGCEPASAISSNKLSAMLMLQGCSDGALVDVNEALIIIPGSYIRIGSNYNPNGSRQKWLIIPRDETGCPCNSAEDYYNILRSIARNDIRETESFNACDLNGMGYCPSPDFNSSVAPPKSPYRTEGTFPAGVGILPIVPRWNSTDGNS
jgi:hypothetical protein